MSLYRLALTLSLLATAGWLVAKNSKPPTGRLSWALSFLRWSRFVELVPYLPSHGGYVGYIIGIVITVLVGRHAILSLSATWKDKNSPSSCRMRGDARN